MNKPHFVAASLFLAICFVLFTKPSGSASDDRSKQRASDLGPAPNRVVVQAAGRGNPYINFEDGIELRANYEGDTELQILLRSNGAEPRALASGDFDEDGVPDLVCGYARADGGVITLHHGNIDSIYPNSPDARRRKADGVFVDSPFISPARVFETPTAADFVGVGDFDADGHWDVVIASRGGKELWLLPGDAKGGFLSAQKIVLAGVVTSLITGEINRADGLTDVVVGIETASAAKALVFEGPEGALKSNPEIISLPSKANALALGQFDDDCSLDLAVGAGSELVIVHGRDRKLSYGETRQAEVPPAKVDRRSLHFGIRSIAAGDLAGSKRISVALLSTEGTVYLMRMKPLESINKKKKGGGGNVELLGEWPGATSLVCARVSTGPANDLILLNQDRRELHILKTGLSSGAASPSSGSVRLGTSLEIDGEPVAVLPIRLNADARSDLLVLRAGQTNPAVVKTGAGVIFTVNTTDDHDDGMCDSNDCTLREAINSANGTGGADTIAFNIPGPGPYTIQSSLQLPTLSEAVTVDGTTQPGFSGKPVIELSSIGLTLSGGNSTVRGMVLRDAPEGLVLTTNGNNVIEGNFVGTDATGTIDRGNRELGIAISGNGNNIIGGTTVSARNLISGSGFNVFAEAVRIIGEGAVNNLVQGNYIGTDFSGTSALENFGFGVNIANGASQNSIGGTTAGARNIISAASQTAVSIVRCPAANNLVQGNFIGTDFSGVLAIPNFFALIVDVSSANTIGGTSPAARNVISGNTGDGIRITTFPGDGLASDNLVQGNWIGINTNGSPLANRGSGVTVKASNNLVGGVAVGSANIIANSFLYGVLIDTEWDPGRNNSVLHNSIFSNIRTGINLGFDEVTTNDPCDTDTGANDLQNFPVLTSATSTGNSTTVLGSLNSTPNTTFTLEFFLNSICNPSGFGEAQLFIGSSTLTTGTNCVANINISLGAIPVGRFITVTATSPGGSTSEFSQCVQVEQGSTFDLCLQDDSGATLLVNSATGDYRFCCNGVTFTGRGTVLRQGNTFTLMHNPSDRRLLATDDESAHKATASLQAPPGTNRCTITDKNTQNNNCVCQ